MAQSIEYPSADFPGPPRITVEVPDDWETLTVPGVQVAAGVPLQCGEGEDFSTFRMGLFGLDKLADPGAAVGRLEAAFDRIGA